jgi:hypothetical protein
MFVRRDPPLQRHCDSSDGGFGGCISVSEVGTEVWLTVLPNVFGPSGEACGPRLPEVPAEFEIPEDHVSVTAPKKVLRQAHVRPEGAKLRRASGLGSRDQLGTRGGDVTASEGDPTERQVSVVDGVPVVPVVGILAGKFKQVLRVRCRQGQLAGFNRTRAPFRKQDEAGLLASWESGPDVQGE